MVWLTNWNYRKAVTVSNTGSTLSDYQTSITIDTLTLINAGKMRSDCGDVRFTDTDGSTLINYWIESGQNTVSTKIWAKIPSVPTSNKWTWDSIIVGFTSDTTKIPIIALRASFGTYPNLLYHLKLTQTQMMSKMHSTMNQESHQKTQRYSCRCLLIGYASANTHLQSQQ